MRDPPALPGGTVVKVFDHEPAPYTDVCLLIRLDKETTIPLPSRHRTIALQYVLWQLGKDWERVRKYLLGEVPHWQVKFILYGSLDPHVEAVSQIDWRLFTTIAPGLVTLDA